MQLDQPQPRHMSVSATLLAAGLTLCWPIVLGFIGGLAAWWLWGEYRFFGWGVAGGVGVGILASAGVAASSAIVARVTAPAPVVEAGPVHTTVTYAYPGSAPNDNIRIIPLSTSARTIDRVPLVDFVWFCHGLKSGHTQRRWLGKRTPSGTIVDPRYWKSLSHPLRKVRLIENVRMRSKGRLVETDPSKILTMLGIDPGEPELYMWRDADDPNG